ncbi:hypothetical protein PIB30_089352 [Stylosanthes scabra]|uniref:Uncharacterized protein n=1 Tax=Stylosanthes scabra TaxID=79078 RepID=A0ABU6YT78_9FABA|nr:hypothetical protein [Stylosanthes scabra]
MVKQLKLWAPSTLTKLMSIPIRLQNTFTVMASRVALAMMMKMVAVVKSGRRRRATQRRRQPRRGKSHRSWNGIDRCRLKRAAPWLVAITISLAEVGHHVAERGHGKRKGWMEEQIRAAYSTGASHQISSPDLGMGCFGGLGSNSDFLSRTHSHQLCTCLHYDNDT